jgi:hypothetical protein
MITQTWVVDQMSAYPQSQGQIDVVFSVAWRLNGTDGTYSASYYGTVNITYVAGSPYTPYADLTEAQVIGWVKTAMGATQVTAYELSINNNINSQITPTVVTPPLPWVE